MGGTFRLNEPQVACEALEGDLILLNFESGFYYNVCGMGADVCSFLISGGQSSVVVTEIARRFELPQEQVERDINAFVEELLKEGLIVAAERSAEQASFPMTSTSYASPTCEKFDDMADQLLLDKIDDHTKDAQWSQAV